MNRHQILDVLKGLTVAGGPIVVLLVQLLGMESGEAEKIVQAIGALISVAGLVWLGMSRTDRALVVEAAQVPGTQVHVDTTAAPKAVVAAARDLKVADVVPMIGGPRADGKAVKGV